jgi:hypothetical protein
MASSALAVNFCARYRRFHARCAMSGEMNRTKKLGWLSLEDARGGGWVFCRAENEVASPAKL